VEAAKQISFAIKRSARLEGSDSLSAKKTTTEMITLEGYLTNNTIGTPA